MNGVAQEKVNASHLKRNAYLYIRQSTLRQVFENTESRLRQYDLRQRAIALGGRRSESSSLITILASLPQLRPIAKDFSDWW